MDGVDKNNITLVQGQGDGGGGNVTRGMERVESTEIVVKDGSWRIGSRIYGVVGGIVDTRIGCVLRIHVVVTFLKSLGGHRRRETTFLLMLMLLLLLLRIIARRRNVGPRSDRRERVSFDDL